MTTNTATSDAAASGPARGVALNTGTPPSSGHANTQRPGSGRWRTLWRCARWVALLGLIGLNAWWYWRSTRPVPELKAIERAVEQKRYDEAERDLQRRLAWSPHDGDARALLAKLYAQRGDMLGCARQLQKVPSWWPGKAKWRLMEATAFKQVDQLAHAEAAWQAIVNDDPLHPVEEKLVSAAVMELLELFAIEGRWSDAARVIWSAYDRMDDPHEREALLVMRMRTEMERIVPAVAAEKLRKYLAANPADREARRALAKAEIALNNPDEGKRLLEAHLQEQPDDSRGWVDYLTLLNDLGDLDTLREVVSRVPSSATEDPGILKFRAQLLERDREWAEASTLYRRVIQARPWERDAVYRLGLIEERLGRPGPAREYRERAEAMRTARSDLADAFQKVLDLRRLKTDTPEVHAALRRLAQVCKTLGWTRDAEGWAALAPREP